MKQNYPLKIAYVYHNTVYTSERGIYFGTRAMVDDAVVGNLVFASKPISGEIMRQSGNLTDTLANAAQYVNAPSFDSLLDGFLSQARESAKVRPSTFPCFIPTRITRWISMAFPKYRRKARCAFEGPMPGQGTNPGWQPNAGIKTPAPPSPNPLPVLVWISRQDSRPAGARR